MKRLLHILVPLLLIAFILISIGWYFLKYDPVLTRDILLQQARYHDEKGNHAAAVWFYDLAYLQSDHDDHVALELADQYISIGNYTKAEYTLSNAIADGGSIELYIALCSTYVQQNKLLDAVTMLNNIADPGIKEQLLALRPDAPTPNYAPGPYSRYITVSFSSAGGECYISTDRQYPSLENGAFQDPIALNAGETVLYGVTVAENGLVSQLGIYSYVIGGVIEEVKFADANFEAAVRQQLQISEDRPIYSNELWNVKEFTIPSTVTDYSDLKWLPDLELLIAENSSCTSLGILSQLTKLQALMISGNPLTDEDLQRIAALPQLNILSLPDCQLSSIAGLANAKKLTYLNLNNNTIRDIRVIRGMEQLETLYMEHNALVDLDSLKALKSLKTLDVSDNSLSSLTPLAELYSLRELDVTNNDLMTLEGLEKLTGLTQLYAAQNNLTDIVPISGCVSLVKLDLSNNTLLSIDPVANMLQLDELNFAFNEVSTLPAFQKDCMLWTINGSNNLISSVEPLADLHHLSYVIMDYNTELEQVSCLRTCHILLTVSVYGTRVTDVQVLKDMSVKVLYDPTIQ